MEETVMTKGIYLLANDKVLDNVIALVNSIRCYDEITPISVIPYDENYQELELIIQQLEAVYIYENLPFLKSLMEVVVDTWHDFPQDHRVNMLKKFGCWFGPFEEFLYIDTDIVVFNPVINLLEAMKGYDFLSYDYQRRTGIEYIFSQEILTSNLISDEQVNSVFNAGFFGSKKGIISEDELFSLIRESRQYSNSFIWEFYDQGILNYWVIRHHLKQINYTTVGEKVPGNWAGSDYLMKDHKLFNIETDQPLTYLHWAGHKIYPDCRYWEIWNHYRHLNPALPAYECPQPPKTSLLQRLKRSVKRLYRQN